MTKKEKIIFIPLFFIIALIIDILSALQIGIDLSTGQYLIYSVVPYILYSFFAAYVDNRSIIYVTAFFVLVIDYFIKFNINQEMIVDKPDIAFSWVLMGPLLLVTLISTVFILFIAFAWFCKKRGLKTSQLKINMPDTLHFEDEELGKFVFVVLAFGFLINFQNIIVLCTSILNSFLSLVSANAQHGESLFWTFISVITSMLPYIVFVLISYLLNSRWISYIVGFTSIIFDIYLKIIAGLFFSSNANANIGANISEVLYSVFNPLTFAMFVPVAFAVLIFAQKFFPKKNSDNEVAQNTCSEE